jgi:hypothetical protein
MIRNVHSHFLYFFVVCLLVPVFGIGQSTPSPAKVDTGKNKLSDKTSGLGVAVSPSSLRFNVKPGSSFHQNVKVTNDSKNVFKFNIAFMDYMQDVTGKPVPAPANYKYGLSKWVNVAPSYIELKPGESRNLTVTVEIPSGDETAVAAYAIMMINQVTERGVLDPSRDKANTVGLGVTPSIGFGVYVYQNPPNVKNNMVEISKFAFAKEKDKSVLKMELINKGDGIGFCSTYIELTNVKTGVQKKLPHRQYTILPGFTRFFDFSLPDDLPKGKYSAVGVMDFGSKDHVEAAELDFTLE